MVQRQPEIVAKLEKDAARPRRARRARSRRWAHAPCTCSATAAARSRLSDHGTTGTGDDRHQRVVRLHPDGQPGHRASLHARVGRHEGDRADLIGSAPRFALAPDFAWRTALAIARCGVDLTPAIPHRPPTCARRRNARSGEGHHDRRRKITRRAFTLAASSAAERALRETRGAQGAPIRIGVINSMSGGYAAYAQEARRPSTT